jgi:hypothetical protein
MPGMAQGLVVVDDDGNETYTPNDGSNFAMAYYLWLCSVNNHGKKMVKSGGGKAVYNPDGTITPPPPIVTTLQPYTIALSPPMKQQFAEQANGFAAFIIPYLQNNAVAVIPAHPAGDGLMKDSTGADCKGPTTQKTLAIT